MKIKPLGFFVLLATLLFGGMFFTPSAHAQSCTNPGPAATGYEWAFSSNNCQMAGAYGSPMCTWSGGTCDASSVNTSGSFEEYSGPPTDIMYCMTYYGCRAIPPPSISGSCSATHYSCSTGTSSNNSSGTLSWTWKCNGSNGGGDVDCSESKNTGVGGASCTPLNVNVNNTTGNVTISGTVSVKKPGQDNSNTSISLSDSAGAGSADNSCPTGSGCPASGDYTNASYTKYFANGTYTAYISGTATANPGSITGSCNGSRDFTVNVSAPSCVAGWSEEELVWDGWTGGGDGWCDGTGWGKCNPNPPNGQTGGHEPSTTGNTIFCCRGADNLGYSRMCGGTPPTCSITSFEPDDYTPTSGTGTTLRFSLNGSFPWSISLLAPSSGGTTPSPTSGTGSGTSATGNLTVDHTYQLTCGSDTEIRTITPEDIITYDLTLNKSGTGDGTTSGAGTYNEDDVANIGATPSAGSYFVDWEGNPDCGDGSVTMTGNKTCVAKFNLTGPGNNPPNPPTISGPTTGNPNTSYNYSFTSTDPQNNKVTYGVDWDDNGTVDDWLPGSSSYVNSGTSQSASNSWSTIGTKTFQALAKDEPGDSSNWQGYTVTISDVPQTCDDPTANNFGDLGSCTYDGGLCGTRSTTYPVGTTGYPSGSAYCEPGIPTSTPSFPPPGGSVSWYCVNGGLSSGLCTASLEVQTFNVTVEAVIIAGGSIKSEDGGIDCGSDCSNEYAEGSDVVLRAIPSSSYWKFSSWSGDCSGTSPECTLTGITDTKNVTANFTLREFRYIEF